MLEIKNDVIKITKGDTAAIRVELTHVNGTSYEMQEGDKLTLTVRKKPSSGIMLSAESSTNVIEMTANMTKLLEVGACCYDIQLETASGEIYTVVGLRDNQLSNMVVWSEITV